MRFRHFNKSWGTPLRGLFSSCFIFEVTINEKYSDASRQMQPCSILPDLCGQRQGRNGPEEEWSPVNELEYVWCYCAPQSSQTLYWARNLVPGTQTLMEVLLVQVAYLVYKEICEVGYYWARQACQLFASKSGLLQIVPTPFACSRLPMARSLSASLWI